MIEKEAPDGDLKSYWLRWRRRRRLPRAEEGKRESSGGTKVNRACQMTLFFSRFANKLKELYYCAALLFIPNKLKLKEYIYIYIYKLRAVWKMIVVVF
jgi:hypothetical protein